MLLRVLTRPSPLPYLALLLLLPMAALAEEGAASGPELELGLTVTQVFEELDLEMDLDGMVPVTEVEPVAERPQAAPLQLASLAPSPEIWREEAAVQEAEDRAAPPKKGFKRWLKRRWWIPVLVAVAVGAVALDDGSDSPDDVEDDD